jgi:lysophospholipase L1-like esterase
MKLLQTLILIVIGGAVIGPPAFAIRPAFAADPNTYLSGLVRELKTPWPNNRTITLVFHGDSVPAGYFKTPVVETFNAYPHLLHVALKERFPNAVINVIITARGGEAAEAGAARFESDVLIHKPDVVLIDYGLNDRRLGLKEAQTAWNLMITMAKRAGAKVVVLTPTPDTTAALNNVQDTLFKHVQQIRRTALLNEVALVDSYRQFTRYADEHGSIEDLMAQTNHPNRKGHELVAAELVKWFQADRAAGQP